MNAKKLYLVIDHSGSMEESAKPLIMRTLVIEIAQINKAFNLGYQIQLVSVADQVEKVEWDPTQEYPNSLFVCKGHFNADGLYNFFKDETDCRVVILSDGFWNRNESRVIKRWIDLLDGNTVFFLRVGAENGSFVRGIKPIETDEIYSVLM